VHFGFDDDQLAFRDAVLALLDKECPPDAVRSAASAVPGQLDRGVWDRLAAMGVLGILVPEDRGGLGLDERSLVLILEEAGRAALPHPLVDTAAVAAPLLGADTGMIATNLGGPHVACAADADRLLLHDPGDGGLHLLDRTDAMLTPVATVDPARRAATVTWDPSAPAPAHPTASWHPAPNPSTSPTTSTLAPDSGGSAWDPGLDFDSSSGDEGDGDDEDDLAWGRGSWDLGAATLVSDDPEVVALALDRGAWATAAVLVGLGQRMVELAVTHVSERHQFGVPVGSFQAVKHQLADAHKDLAFARPVVHRAAHSLATGSADRSRDVSMAKALAGDAAWRAGRIALQCHGAIGYTVEHDLHLYLKRTWALAKSYGDAGWHRDRVARAIGI
jgi:Acyl-CoA dehydrogenase, C-terminal domain/Acyl-CoA dehydrogenase, N-terminal domain